MFPWDRPQCRSPSLRSCRSLGDRLRIALLRSKLEDFWTLIEEGGDVNERDRHEQTMLHMCLYWKKDITIVKAVLSAGADPNALDIQGHSALHVAIELKSNPAIIKALLNAGAEIEMPDSRGMTPLMKSINHLNNAPIVRMLLKEGANVLVENLMAEAVRTKTDHEVLRLLVLSRAPVNETNTGITPISYAVMNGDVKVVRLLIAAGANLEFKHAETRCTLLHQAYKTDVARLLIKKGLDVEAVDIHGATPLHTAVKDDVIDVANMLIEAGADVHRPVHRKGDNCMHLARSVPMVKMLASHNVDINARNVQGATPLFTLLAFCNLMSTPFIGYVGSYMRSNAETYFDKLRKGIMGVKEMIKRGADVNAICTEDQSVMELAVTLGDPKIVSYMIKYGVHVVWEPLFRSNLIDTRGIRLLIRESLIGNVQGENLFDMYPANADYPEETLHWLIYANRCRAEIGRMKETKINCKNTIYHYIVEIGSNVKALRSCPHYEVTDEDKKSLFPNYRNKIAVRVNKCYRRAGLLDFLESIEISAPTADGQRVVSLINDCKFAIAEFLSNKQLYNFLLGMGMEVPGSGICPKPMNCK